MHPGNKNPASRCSGSMRSFAVGHLPTPPPTPPPHIRASGAGSVGRRYGTYHAGVRGPHRVWGVCTPPLRHICGRSRAEHRPRGVPEGPEWCCPRPPLADIGTQAFSHPGRARPGAARIGHKKFSIIYTESAVLGLVRHEWQLRKGDLAPGGGVGWSGGLGGGSACACRVGSSTFAPHSLTVSRCRATRRPGRWYFPATSRCREAHLAVGQHPQVRRPLPSPGRCSGCRPRPPFPPSPPRAERPGPREGVRRAEEEEEEKALCFLPLAPVPWVVPRGCELPWARSGARWLVKCPRPCGCAHRSRPDATPWVTCEP